MEQQERGSVAKSNGCQQSTERLMTFTKEENNATLEILRGQDASADSSSEVKQEAPLVELGQT